MRGQAVGEVVPPFDSGLGVHSMPDGDRDHAPGLMVLPAVNVEAVLGAFTAPTRAYTPCAETQAAVVLLSGLR